MTEEQRKAGSTDFGALLKTPEGRKRFKLAAVYADDFGPDTLFPWGNRAGATDLVVTDGVEPSRRYYFGVDWSNGDFRIVTVNYLTLGC